MNSKIYILFFISNLCFYSVKAQSNYPVAQELLPLLDKIPNLNLSLTKANKISSCGEACCTENAIKDLLNNLSKIDLERKNPPIEKEKKNLNLSDLNLAEVTNLDLKSSAATLAKGTIKVLDANPSMLSGKTIKVLDSNPAMLGNKNVKVLDTNPSMLSNKKTTKSLDTNPSMLSNTNSSSSNKQQTEKKNTPVTESKNEIDVELERLLKDESNFRENINSEWEKLQKEYNTEIEKNLKLKSDIEKNTALDAKNKSKQTNDLSKTSSNYYSSFMQTKAEPLLKQQKENVIERYSYLEILIKQSNYGINENNLYPSINNAQNTLLEIIEALGVYSADCITAGCQLNKEF